MSRPRHWRSHGWSTRISALSLAYCLLLGGYDTALGAEAGTSSSERAEPRVKKSIVVDQTKQMLYAYAGKHLVLSSPISTGRNHATPNGRFTVLDKQRIHYSRLFDNAPMPFSAHLSGNYFIHGFSEVPEFPASHGCIRVDENFANVLYDWMDVGIPVVVTGRWEPPRVPVRISTNDSLPVRTAQYVPSLREKTAGD